MSSNQSNRFFQYSGSEDAGPASRREPNDVVGGAAPTPRQKFEALIDLVYRRKWIVLAGAVIGLSVAAWKMHQEVPTYRARSVVMVDLARPGSSEAGPISAGNIFGTNMRTLSGELFVLENSNAISERVNERLQGMSPKGQVAFASAGRDVGNAIQIVASGPDAREAALLANLYAEEYVRLTQEANRSNMAASLQYLEKQEEQRREELRAAEEAVQRYLENGGLVLDRLSSSVVSTVAGMEAQRDDARIELQMRTSALAATEAELEKISPELAHRIASGVERKIQVAQQKLAQLEGRRNDILVSFPDAGEVELAEKTDLPSIRSSISQLQREIDDLSTQLVEEVSAAGGTIAGEQGLSYVAELRRQAAQERIHIGGVEAKIAVMESRLAEYESRMADLPEHSMELARMERGRRHAERMYQFVAERLQETQLAEQSEPGYAHILTRAAVPEAPRAKSLPRQLVMWLLLGLGLGVAGAYGRDRLDNKAYKPDNLRAQGYPVVSTIPNLRPLIKDDHDQQEAIEHEGRMLSTNLVTLLNPMSSAAESYRHLRTSVQFARLDRVVNTILVTSPGMGEGKSVTASNLAVTLAQAGRRTILIDADLRRPNLHRLWGVDRTPGLVQTLFESTDKEEFETWRTVAHNLSLITAGGWEMHGDEIPGYEAAREAHGGNEPVVVNPAELLGSKSMRDLLDELRRRFDVIVIDTPPVLAASDAALLATQADSTLLVVRAAHTREGEIEEAMADLNRVGAHVMGLLFNAFDISMAYGRKYRYGQYSKYGPYDKYGYYTHTAG